VADIDTARDVLTADAGVFLDFADGDSSAHSRGEGWSDREPGSVWSVGAASHLTLPPCGSAGRAAILDLDIAPCVAPPLVLGQWLAVHANGHPLGWQHITGPSQVRCHIPPEIAGAGGSIRIDFEHPCFVRLDQLGVRADDRPLALQFFALRLFPQSREPMIDTGMPLRPGLQRLELRPLPSPPSTAASETHDFRNGTPASVSLRDGWHTGDGGVVWTAARISRLGLAAPAFGAPTNLRIGLAPLTIKDLAPAQRLAVTAGGLMLAQFQLRGETSLSIAVPPGLPLETDAAGQSRIGLTFSTPDALPMRQFAWNMPELLLGVAIDWIVAEQVPLRARKAAALRGDSVHEAPPLAVSRNFLDLAAEDVHGAIESELKMTAADLMRGFESLGDNCAFGLAQRKAGAEILGLLRFANTPLRSLLLGLADDFSAATNKTEIDLYLHTDGNPREYMLGIQRYGIRWHTMVHEPDAEASVVAAEQITKLGFLRRKFADGVRKGRKIYTLARAEPLKYGVAVPGYGAPQAASSSRGKTHLMPAWDPPQTYEVTPAPLCLAEAQTVFFALNRSGPNTLLYFVPATSSCPAGTVELLAPGLMRGYMASFVILPDGDLPNDVDWVRVAANAWLLNRDANAEFRHMEKA
jgi:hypothetical protein